MFDVVCDHMGKSRKISSPSDNSLTFSLCWFFWFFASRVVAFYKFQVLGIFDSCRIFQ